MNYKIEPLISIPSDVSLDGAKRMYGISIEIDNHDPMFPYLLALLGDAIDEAEAQAGTPDPDPPTLDTICLIQEVSVSDIDGFGSNDTKRRAICDALRASARDRAEKRRP